MRLEGRLYGVEGDEPPQIYDTDTEVIVDLLCWA